MRNEGRGGGGARQEVGHTGAGRSAAIADLRRRIEALGGGPRGGAFREGTAGRDTGAGNGVIPGYDAVLAAPAPLAELLPSGGLPCGSVVSVISDAPGGGGATSLVMALLAAPAEAWVAVVGMPDFGVLAAAEMGVNLSRLGLVPDPGREVAQVLSVLVGGVDMIAVTGPERWPARLPPARQRVLSGRLRESGTVLLVAGRWPGADLVFAVREVRWSGIGRGHGRLRDRELDVRIAGRRAGAAMGAQMSLALRADRNGVMVGASSAAETEAGLPGSTAESAARHRVAG